MRAILLATLLSSSSSLVHGHPTASPVPRGLTRRTVDLNAFRIPLVAKYTNATEVAVDPPVVSLAKKRGSSSAKRDDYVDVATELVKKTVSDSTTFRLVSDHYIGNNGVAHVNFKQTANGLDIDNADFNVNVAADGTIFSFGNSFFTGEVPSAAPIQKREVVGPVEALQGAAEVLQLPVSATSATAEPAEGEEVYSIKGSSGAVSDPEARLVYFQTEDGTLKLTWRVETDILDNWLLTYIDAQTNKEVHAVVDYSADASYRV